MRKSKIESQSHELRFRARCSTTHCLDFRRKLGSEPIARCRLAPPIVLAAMESMVDRTIGRPDKRFPRREGSRHIPVCRSAGGGSLGERGGRGVGGRVGVREGESFLRVEVSIGGLVEGGEVGREGVVGVPDGGIDGRRVRSGPLRVIVVKAVDVVRVRRRDASESARRSKIATIARIAVLVGGVGPHPIPDRLGADERIFFCPITIEERRREGRRSVRRCLLEDAPDGSHRCRRRSDIPPSLVLLLLTCSKPNVSYPMGELLVVVVIVQGLTPLVVVLPGVPYLTIILAFEKAVLADASTSGRTSCTTMDARARIDRTPRPSIRHLDARPPFTPCCSRCILLDNHRLSLGRLFLLRLGPQRVLPRQLGGRRQPRHRPILIVLVPVLLGGEMRDGGRGNLGLAGAEAGELAGFFLGRVAAKDPVVLRFALAVLVFENVGDAGETTAGDERGQPAARRDRKERVRREGPNLFRFASLPNDPIFLIIIEALDAAEAIEMLSVEAFFMLKSERDRLGAPLVVRVEASSELATGVEVKVGV